MSKQDDYSKPFTLGPTVEESDAQPVAEAEKFNEKLDELRQENQLLRDALRGSKEAQEKLRSMQREGEGEQEGEGPATSVFCRTQFEAFHFWSSPPEEVSHLRHRHRHIFKVEVEVEVSHANRDVEFQLLKREVDEHIDHAKSEVDTDTWSCEHWAEYLWSALEGRYEPTIIEVNEDGENGARLRK